MWAQKHFTEKNSFEQVLKTPDAAILFNNELLKIAQKERLRPHEIPLGVILVPEALLKGDDRKIMRHQLEKQFQKEISETYERLGEEPQKNTPINNVNNPNNEEIVQRIMKMLDELGISSPEADPNSM
jgi:thymidylate kinase